MRKRFLYIFGLFYLTLTSATCNSQNTQESANSNTRNISTTAKQVNYAEGRDYTIMKRARIEDKAAFSEPVEVFSFLIPHNWEYDGEVTWIVPGQWGSGNYMEFHAESPDKAWQFTMYPAQAISYSGLPMINEMNMRFSNERVWVGNPVSAEEYLNQYFLPQLGNPELLSTHEEEYPEKDVESLREKNQEILMYDGVMKIDYFPSAVSARVRWSDDSEGIVWCKSMIAIQTSMNYLTGQPIKDYTNVIGYKMVFRYPPEEKSHSEKLFTTIVTSIRENPAWRETVDEFWKEIRMQNRRQMWDQIKMTNEYSRRNHENRMAAMDANMRSWEARQSSQDRQHETFIKSIRGVETYQDATGTYEMNSNYNHAWSRGDGSSFIMTDNPNFDPSSVFQDQEWKQMKRVE